MRSLWQYLRHKPLQRRVTLLTVVLVSVSIVLSNLAGYVALRVTLYRASEGVALSIARELVPPAAKALAQSGQLSGEVRQAGGVVVEAVRPGSLPLRVPGSTAQLVLEEGDLQAAHPGAEPVRRTGVDLAGQRYMVVAVPLEATGFALVVARPLAGVLSVLKVERVIVACIVVAGMLGAVVAAIFVARSGLRPVRELTKAVQHVTATKEFRPISIGYASGDLAVLTRSFNQLLRAVTTMRERQSRLVADAGHELRTPLTSLTTNVDLLLVDLPTNQLSAEQKGEVLRDIKAQLNELTNLVGDLVQLSRGDSATAFRALDLRDVVHAAVARVRRRGVGHTFDVQLDEFHVVGDRDGLERAVANLLDNAVKWSPPGSTIRVRLHGNRLTVADCGPGIAEADLPYVFDRFFRGDSARSTQGTGLGLSIVAKTVEDHGGTVRAGRSREGGAEFTIQLPGVTHRDALPDLLVPVG